MTKEYVVFRSKYKVNGELENCLTYSPETTLAKSNVGTYTYYHIGKKIWEVKDSNKTFEEQLDGTMQKKQREHNYNYEFLLNEYPIYKKYSDDCQKFSQKEYNY